MTTTSQAAAKPAAINIAKHIDASTLQCPGPIIRLATEMATLKEGQAVSIVASDPAFPMDVKGWCHSTGHTLVEVKPQGGQYRATIVKAPSATQPSAVCAVAAAKPVEAHGKTIVVFSNDLDRVMAAFIIANGAASMGSDVTLFFTFWGLNVLRRAQGPGVPKTLMERMFGWMMPKGAGKLTLSKMHMMGMGTAMMKGVMKSKNVTPLNELIDSARKAGVRLVACTMTMDIMGIKPQELIDGVEYGGVASYLDTAERGNVNLFI